MTELRTGVIVPIPAAAPVVDRWRERTCNGRPSLGVPPHVTLVYPFVRAVDLTDEVLSAVAEILSSAPRFALELGATMRLGGALCLAPDPAAPFVHLTEAIVRRFPEHPPYGDPHAAIVPHLTVAQGDDGTLAAAERDVSSALPIRATVTGAGLLEEVEPDGARWRIRAWLPLG